MNVTELQNLLRNHREATGHDVSAHVSRGSSIFGITLPTAHQSFEIHNADKPMSQYTGDSYMWGHIPQKYTSSYSTHPLENGLTLDVHSHSYGDPTPVINLSVYGRKTRRDLQGNEWHTLDYGPGIPTDDGVEFGATHPVTNRQEAMDFLRKVSSIRHPGTYEVDMPRSGNRVRPMDAEEWREHAKEWPIARLAHQAAHLSLFGDFPANEGRLYDSGDGRQFVSNFGIPNPLKHLMVHQHWSEFPVTNPTHRNTHYYDANTEQLFAHPDNLLNRGLK